MEDTSYRRRLPGEGEFDLVGFLQLLDDRGVTAPISVEILSNELAAPASGDGGQAGLRRGGVHGGSSPGSPMKLGLRLELYRAAVLAVPMDADPEGRGARISLGVDRRGVRQRRPVASRLRGRPDQAHQARDLGRPAGRPAAATLAMHAMTIDALAGGGRVIIGIGVSGPQIVEGWYGQPWGSPNARLRDYVTIVGKVLRREEPVSHDGPEISLPYRGARRPRPGQGAEVDHASERPDTHLAGLGRAEEHRAVRRAVRRLAADGSRSPWHGELPRRSSTGASPDGRRRRPFRDLHGLQRHVHRRRAGQSWTP